MYYVFIVLHVIACFVLILVILLQAGRGGGLSEMFGAGMQQQQKLFGTETNALLSKATTYAAALFIITSISLGVITTRRGRSLMDARSVQSVLPAGAVKMTPFPLEGAVTENENSNLEILEESPTKVSDEAGKTRSRAAEPENSTSDLNP